MTGRESNIHKVISRQQSLGTNFVTGMPLTLKTLLLKGSDITTSNISLKHWSNFNACFVLHCCQLCTAEAVGVGRSQLKFGFNSKPNMGLLGFCTTQLNAITNANPNTNPKPTLNLTLTHGVWCTQIEESQQLAALCDVILSSSLMITVKWNTVISAGSSS